MPADPCPACVELRVLVDVRTTSRDDARRERDEARAVFRDAVHMLAHIARAAGFDPNDPTVEPPAIVARVERLRANAEGTNRVLRDQEDEIARLRDALAAALAREVVALRVERLRANAEGTNRVLRDQEDEIARLRDALAAAEQERDAANARLSAIVEAYQDSTGNQTTAEQLPADIAALAENAGRLAAGCDTYEEFMRDLLVAIGADPAAWDSLDEQAKAVEHAKALVRSLEDASAEVERLRAADEVKP